MRKITKEQKTLFLNSAEFEKIVRSRISKYKKSEEYERFRNALIARGEIKALDYLYLNLTLEQKTNIINDETPDIGNWKLSDWWKGMTKTEKNESLIKLNLKK